MGCASGKGVLHEQSISDLVAYIESLSTTPDKAQAAATKELEKCDRAACVGRDTLDDPEVQDAAEAWVTDAQAALDEAQVLLDESSVADTTKYTKLVQEKQETLQVAQDWLATTQSASEGELLFMNNCARCHTAGGRTSTPPTPIPRAPTAPWRPGSWVAAPTVPTSPVAT